MGVSSVNPATRRQRCSRISFSAMLFSSVWLLLALYLSPVNGWAPVAESDHVQTKMLSYRPQEQKDNQKIEVIGEIKAQSTDDQDKFDITIFWHSKPQNNNNNNEKWIPIATRLC